MNAQRLDLDTWPGADQFRFFKTYGRPHFAVTSRMDASRLMEAKASRGISPFRAVIWAIGHALHAVPELRTRFRGDAVTRYERLRLSPTVPLESGDFRFTYLDWTEDRAAFDAHAATEIDRIRAGQPLNPNDPARQDVAFLSCLPWLDYTALDNALPDAEDCIPRVGWGKIVDQGGGCREMAMTIQVHHALVHGRHVGAFFSGVQSALDAL
ncbi:MAG: CatA-like O-acetyltransferase [Pseudomonadota bacterium]